jgi:hypothetical protein
VRLVRWAWGRLQAKPGATAARPSELPSEQSNELPSEERVP